MTTPPMNPVAAGDLFGWWSNWDAVRPTSECVHCDGTGVAPGDGSTECGFCDESEYDPVRAAEDAAVERYDAWREQEGFSPTDVGALEIYRHGS